MKVHHFLFQFYLDNNTTSLFISVHVWVQSNLSLWKAYFQEEMRARHSSLLNCFANQNIIMNKANFICLTLNDRQDHLTFKQINQSSQNCVPKEVRSRSLTAQP